MNKTTEALKLAEEALAEADRYYDYDDVLAAIREALAEPVKQEPVAWYLDTFDEDGELDDREYNTINKFSCGRGNGTPLYAAPVDAKAIRAEALEEAAKVCDDESRYSNDAECCAADIRGLK